MNMKPSTISVFALAIGMMLISVQTESHAVRQDATFKSSAERVTVAVVARDRDGRALTGLSAADFEVIDEGERRLILDFRNDVNTISVALLLDTSGSMFIGPKIQRASEVGHFLLAALTEEVDEAALFVFDKTVRTAHPFTGRFDALRAAFAGLHPFGSTSLYDAIAETSRELAIRPGRRALVVLTDGVDTSSQLTAAAVSGLASAIDMPVYIVVVDRLSGTRTDAADLTDLARWSGGMFYQAASTAEGTIAARQIVTDLRHQYLIAFEPSSNVGWHRIEVRSGQRVTLQARSGYWVLPATP